MVAWGSAEKSRSAGDGRDGFDALCRRATLASVWQRNRHSGQLGGIDGVRTCAYLSCGGDFSSGTRWAAAAGGLCAWNDRRSAAERFWQGRFPVGWSGSEADRVGVVRLRSGLLGRGEADCGGGESDEDGGDFVGGGRRR